MIVLHVLAAVLASWRLTELIAVDRISEPLRKRFPHYLWTCARCLSVWTGGACTLAFLYAPWLNWPLAFAWLYLVEWDYRSRIVGQIDARAHAEVVRRAMDAEERQKRETPALTARGFVAVGNGRR